MDMPYGHLAQAFLPIVEALLALFSCYLGLSAADVHLSQFCQRIGSLRSHGSGTLAMPTFTVSALTVLQEAHIHEPNTTCFPAHSWLDDDLRRDRPR